jgi:16S rRNA (guanine966-N2)-methyltransferase
MRVIAGQYRGRRLRSPKGLATRPTSDRARESLFALLGDVTGSRAIDLFAGTGALGIEALSRGAAHVVFVERDREALEVARANLQALGVGPDRGSLRHEDALRALGRARDRKETYDLVLIDPPYGQAREWGARLSALLPQLLQPGARLVAESDHRAPLELESELELVRQRRYGNTEIRIYRHERHALSRQANEVPR